MCPACYAALAWTIAGWTTGGGAVTLVIAKVFGKWRRRSVCSRCQPEADSPA